MVDVKQIKDLLKTYFIIDGCYTIDPLSGVVDVQGDVDLFPKKIQKLPVQFGYASRDFKCYNNELTSLQGAPAYVGRDFFCYLNNLTFLTGAPKQVGGKFECSNNKLTSLVGSPDNVGQNFSCHNNELTNLVGAPTRVRGNFYCHNNPLTRLSGAPDHVGGEFEVTYASDLPLLRLCGYSSVVILDGPDEVKVIMEKYAHTGRSGALKAAAELIRAGYRKNAQW